MGLKERVDEALDALDWLDRSPGAAPRLASLKDGPVVITRFMGQDIVGDRFRPRVDIFVVVGVAETTSISDGQDLEALNDRIVGVLYTVPDCYPELIPVAVDYNNRMFGKENFQRGSQKASGRDYIVMRIGVLGS